MHQASRAPRQALLYTRVSTDEQADRGYSLRDQEACLRQYCQRESIEVVGHYQDDASAKTFERPAWREMMAFIKANRNAVDMLLVGKWDRFSRDATGALGMIRTLEALGVRVQAAEQPVDLLVPEQMLMLAIYVAAPDVENRRRSLATKAGMRRAMREGRWTTKPPTGYTAQRGADGKARLVLGPLAPLVREAFEWAAYSQESLSEIQRRLREKGLLVSRPALPRLLRNVAYLGKILIPAWQGPSGYEPEELIEGLHEALVEDVVFFKAQERFSPARKGRRHEHRAELPLRGHLRCRLCDGMMTGSGSRSHTGRRYWYYQCQRGCRERFRAERAHEALTRYLQGLEIAPEVAALYARIQAEIRREERARSLERQAGLQREIEQVEERLFSADEKFVEGQLSRDSYERLKRRYDEALHRARLKQSTLAEQPFLSEQWVVATRLFSNLSTLYDEASLESKAALLGSIFPNHLVFSSGSYGTTPESEIIALLRGKTQKPSAGEGAEGLDDAFGFPNVSGTPKMA